MSGACTSDANADRDTLISCSLNTTSTIEPPIERLSPGMGSAVNQFDLQVKMRLYQLFSRVKAEGNADGPKFTDRSDAFSC